MSSTPGAPPRPAEHRPPASPGSPQVLPGTRAYPSRSRMPGVLAHPIVRGMLVYLLLALVLGALAGLVWHWLAPLPSYLVGDNGAAATSERGLTEVFGADAWYCLIGSVVGLGLGALGWRWFHRVGWPVTVLVLVATLGSALVCWWVGQAQGPGAFDARLAEAAKGDRVPVEFALHSPVAVLVWLFFALVPVLFASSLGRDADDPRPGRWRRRPVQRAIES